MKSLTLPSLLLSVAALAALTVRPAEATPAVICSQATIDSDASVPFNGGVENLVSTCTLAGSKKLQLTSTAPDAISSGKGAATIQITGTTFADASMLWYFAGTESTMSTVVPYKLYVSGNTFSRNAVLVFQGSFPKDSVIEVSNNIWVGISSPHSVYGALAAHAIFFYTDSTQRLDERTSIKITGNTIPVSVSGAAYAIGVNAPLSLYANAKIEISGNDLSCTSSAANSLFPAVIGWGFSSGFTIAGEDTSIIINNNKITGGSDAVGIYLPVMNSVGKSFNLNVTNNVISLNGAQFFPVRARGLNVAKNSKVFITDNVMTSVGTDSRLLITGLTIGGASQVTISRNKLDAYGGNAVLSFEDATQIAGSAQFNVEFNDIFRTDDFANGVPGIQFISSLALSGTSVTSFSYNNFDAIGRPAHYMVYSSTASKSDTAHLYICNNIHYGSILTSFSVYLTADINTLMDNQTSCLARTTAAPKTTATARSTTTVRAASTTLPSGVTGAPGVSSSSAPVVTDVSGATTSFSNETVDANATTAEPNGNETAAPTTSATFAPPVNETDPPLNNQVGGRTASFAMMCASLVAFAVAALH